MQVKSIAEGEHSAIFSNFIKLLFVIKIFVLSIFERLFYTGFTVRYKDWSHSKFIASSFLKFLANLAYLVHVILSKISR